VWQAVESAGARHGNAVHECWIDRIERNGEAAGCRPGQRGERERNQRSAASRQHPVVHNPEGRKGGGDGAEAIRLATLSHHRPKEDSTFAGAISPRPGAAKAVVSKSGMGIAFRIGASALLKSQFDLIPDSDTDL
jgi:hypothetical protein